MKLLCEWLESIEPPKLTEAVYEFRRACKAATQPEVEWTSLLAEVCKMLQVFVGYCFVQLKALCRDIALITLIGPSLSEPHINGTAVH